MAGDPQLRLDFERIPEADLPRMKFVAWWAMHCRVHEGDSPEQLEADRQRIARECGFDLAS